MRRWLIKWVAVVIGMLITMLTWLVFVSIIPSANNAMWPLYFFLPLLVAITGMIFRYAIKPYMRLYIVNNGVQNEAHLTIYSLPNEPFLLSSVPSGLSDVFKKATEFLLQPPQPKAFNFIGAVNSKVLWAENENKERLSLLWDYSSDRGDKKQLANLVINSIRYGDAETVRFCLGNKRRMAKTKFYSISELRDCVGFTLDLNV